MLTAGPLPALTTFRGVSAYVTGGAAMAAGRPSPALLLLQEWWGLNPQMVGLADRFAKRGFLVIVPDLYHGKVTTEASEANHLMSGLDFQAAVQEVGTWIDYARTEKHAPAVGISGFCMGLPSSARGKDAYGFEWMVGIIGGALSIAAASALGDKLQACVPFYGIPDLNMFPTAGIQCPLLIMAGQQDNLKGFSDPQTVQKLVHSLEREGKTFQVQTYADAGHAFMNEQRPDAYRPKTAQDAFEKAVLFFQQHLK